MSAGLPLVQLALLGEAVSAAAGVAVFVWDDDRTYVAVNDAACKLAVLEREELLTMRVGDLSPDRAEPQFDDVQRQDVSTGSSTFTPRRDDGRDRLADLPHEARRPALHGQRLLAEAPSGIAG
ncbi:MAG: PAS domain-containing protein [Actinomycetota bacterium]